jgi:hypothetical protein
MNFNRLVNRYHIKVKELAVPTDEEVSNRTADRLVTVLAADAAALSVDDAIGLVPVARRIAEHEQRDRIVAALVRARFASAAAPEEAEEPPSAPPPRRSEGPGGGRGRPGGDRGQSGTTCLAAHRRGDCRRRRATNRPAGSDRLRLA